MAAKKKTATKRKAAKKRAPKRKKAETIERLYKGKKHVVTVSADGFTYKGASYRSLTAVAKAITGYASVSGPRFFGIDEASKKGGAK